jgi:hypothetical protein
MHPKVGTCWRLGEGTKTFLGGTGGTGWSEPPGWVRRGTQRSGGGTYPPYPHAQLWMHPFSGTDAKESTPSKFEKNPFYHLLF